MKKSIAILLMVLVLLSGAALAADADWDFDASYYFVRGYTGSEAQVVMPSWLEGCPVEVLEDGVLENHQELESMVLSENLMDLRDYNFINTVNLKSVTLPESLMAIGNCNFYQCDALTEVTVPSRVYYVGQDCFSCCDVLTKVTFEGVCPVFAPGCFQWNDQAVTIFVPDDQLDAYRAALPDQNVQPSGRMAVVHDYTSDENFYTITDSSITYYDGYETRVDIPPVIYGVPVTEIGDEAFPASAYITWITVPEGVTAIGDNAFYALYELVHVELPSTLKSIGAGAFEDFRGYSIELPEGLETIGSGAFRRASLMGQLVLPSTLTSVSADFLDGCTALTELVVKGDPAVLPAELKEYNPDLMITVASAPAAPADAEASAFVGTWHVQTLEMGDMVMDAAMMGMMMDLTFYEDGTVTVYDGDTTETSVWTLSGNAAIVEGMPLIITPEGMLRMEEDGAVILFARGEEAQSETELTEEEQMLLLLAMMEAMSETEPEPTPVPTEEPQGFNSLEDYLNLKFICGTYTASGFTMDGATLGAEYSVIFYENGTCDLIMGGVEVKGLAWGLNSVAVGLKKTDAFVINYYGTSLNAIPTPEGFDMDYFGGMMLHLIPAR